MVQRMGFGRTENGAGSGSSRVTLQTTQTTRPVLFGTPKKLAPSTPPPSSRKPKRGTPPMMQFDPTSELDGDDDGDAMPDTITPSYKKPRTLKRSTTASSSIDPADMTSD